jgi:hypothetical protein
MKIGSKDPILVREVNNMVRSIVGVVSGAVVWMVGFFVFALVLAQLWPDYAIHVSGRDRAHLHSHR